MKRSPPEWLNLGLASLLLFYAIMFAWQTLPEIDCSRIGTDYCEHLSAGLVANTHGYPAIYHLNLLEQAQRTLLPKAPYLSSASVLPFLYLPVFLLPFLGLSRLSVGGGFWLWTAFNVAALGYYLRSFARRLNLRIC